MNMLEDMQKMMMLEQQMQAQGGQQSQGFPLPGMQQQLAPQMPQGQGMESPIEMGSMAALNATKRSLQMNESENQRALGRALLTMMSSVNKNPSYGNGFSGNLGAMAEGMIPALFEYDEERRRIANTNEYLLRQKKEEAALARKEDREMKRMAHEMAMQKQNLAINQGYLNLERQKRADERSEHDALTKGGGRIPLSSLGKSGFNYAQQYMDKKAERGEAAAAAIHNIDEIAQILRDDPKLTKDWSVIALAAQRKDPSIARQKITGWLIPEERRVRAELLAKNLMNLTTASIKGTPARAMNKMYESWLKEGNADINMLSGSMIKILEHARENNSRIYNDWLKSHEAYQEGFFERSKPIELKELSDEEIHDLFHGKPSDSKKSAEPDKNQKILEEIKRLEAMMATAPE